jgi:hypothetical protein
MTDLQTALRAYRDETTFLAMLDKYEAANERMREFLLRYPLEEMAVETLLMGEYDRGALQFVDADKFSSYSYVAESGDKALELVQTFDSVSAQLTQEIDQRSYTNARARLATIDGERTQFETQVSSLTEQAKRNRDSTRGWGGFSATSADVTARPAPARAAPSSHAIDCGRNAEVDEFVRAAQAIRL